MAETEAHTQDGPDPDPDGVGTAGKRVVLVTGLSGAGMSTTLKALEDLGYDAIDNLPLAIIPVLIDRLTPDTGALALGIDTRTRDFTPDGLAAALDDLRGRPGLAVDLIFLDCDADTLLRRFSETRRRHPLAIDRPVADGIEHERALLGPVRDSADTVIDTSRFAVHDFRALVAERYRLEHQPGLYIQVLSFSYKRGLPREADLVFDVRFLTNPHWDPDLRALDGRDAPVQAAIRRDPDFDSFFGRLRGFILPLVPRYTQEGKRYLTLALGCTGGRHRSVYLAERLHACLTERGLRAGLRHRDLG